MSEKIEVIESGEESSTTITGQEFSASEHRYIVGRCAGQPVICIEVDPESAEAIYLEYDEVSLAAANELVLEIEAGIKERNHA